jgi:serine/threonine-protein kinase
MDVPGYDILEEVGRGAGTVVYRARQRASDRVVAIRTTGPGVDSPEVDEYLRKEATMLARLRHPHVVSILDRVESNGPVCLVLEYVDGGTLAERTAGQAQPVRAAAGLVECLAHTLDYVHRCGIIHSDLRTSDVLLAAPPGAVPRDRAESLDYQDVYGIPLIKGFELARDRQSAAVVEQGGIHDTPYFIAPEQAEGHPQNVGPPTDIYALGAILYLLLAGRPPSKAASTMDLILQLLESKPESVRKLNPDVDHKLEAICHRCLHKKPASRYQSGWALACDLRSYLDGPSRKRRF